MLSYHFLLDLAIILLSTKIFGIITKKVQMPQVVGALLAGLILGPAVLKVVHETDFIKQLSELGVIVLMFTAGMETDLKELKKSGFASFVIALFGVLVPLAGGFIVAAIFNGGTLSGMDTKKLLENIFIGVILTATSVSITVETLKELGKLNSRSGTAILGAAVIDDVLGIIILTIVTSSADASVQISIVLLKIAAFFLVAAAIGFPFYHLFDKYTQRYDKEKRRFVIISFSFCLVMSFIAEHYFGVADITGAFIAGIVISNTFQAKYIARRFDILSYMFLSPIFFASIGISTTFDGMGTSILILSVVLLAVAILTKIIGCGIGALICKYSKEESLRIGVGMISRGEVALIVANKGAAVGLMKGIFFGPVILTVIVTTIVTPVLLKLVYGGKKQQVFAEEQERLAG